MLSFVRDCSYVYDASKSKWVTKVIETQIQQYSLKCSFIIWDSVSPLLFLFLDGFNLFAIDYEERYWLVIVPVIE